MSDNEFMEEDDDYGFDYEDDDNEVMQSDGDEDGEPELMDPSRKWSLSDLENGYYLAKSRKDQETSDAAKHAFQVVIAAQHDTKTEWGFRCLKQLFKIHFHERDYENAMKYFNELLTFMKNAVSRNYGEKSLCNLLDLIATTDQMTFMEACYATALSVLEETKNERLSFKCRLKLAKLWLDRGDGPRFSKIIRQLHTSCQTETGEDDQKKGTQLLEIYAMDIQYHSLYTQDHVRLQSLYHACLDIKSAVPHPRIMGIIRECGGKMHMRNGAWQAAQTDFFESFRNYDEAGSTQRIQVLKYLVLANMLSHSSINPFESQETKPYKSHSDIVAMTNLIVAYEAKDCSEFDRILSQHRRQILDDPFIRDYVEELLLNVRTEALFTLLQPYESMDFEHVARTLKWSVEQVETHLAALIRNGRLAGRIDQPAAIWKRSAQRQANDTFHWQKDLSRLALQWESLLETSNE